MRIFLQSDDETKDLFKELEFLTNSAEITLSYLNIDEINKKIVIPLVRKNYRRKKGFLRGSYKLSSSKLIKSELIVKNILDYEINDNLNLKSIDILFGVNISNKEIYLSSVEERSGVTAFDLSIKVSSYDLELIDKE